MRIIRFVADDGSVLCGRENNDGTATIVRDTRGVLGTYAAAAKLSLLRGKRVVIADDDENMRRMLSTVLQRTGCRCTVCADGAEAMRAIEKNSVDIVVSDIMMPHHDGYEIFAAAKSKSEDIPVLLITGFGYDPSHSLVRANDEGLEAVLYKPFTPQQLIEEVIRAVETHDRDTGASLQVTDEQAQVSAVLTPVRPSNILCVGRNYIDQNYEGPGAPSTSDPLEVFMKPTTALLASGRPIQIPHFEGQDAQVDCEGELAVVIGKTADDVSVDDAMEHVLGYTIANDVTAKLWQTGGGAPLWMRGKGFNSFCPLGPLLVTADSIDDPGDLEVITTVNGVEVRRGNTGQMLRSIPQIISELSRYIKLDPGTVLLTGAPPRDPDVPFLKAADEVAVEIPSIGRLVNPVVYRAS